MPKGNDPQAAKFTLLRVFHNGQMVHHTALEQLTATTDDVATGMSNMRCRMTAFDPERTHTLPDDLRDSFVFTCRFCVST